MPEPGEIAKVLDFGIAKLKEARSMGMETNGLTHSGTGLVIGTPKYMSPEQARGMKGEQLDGRFGPYSLGMVMYEMLTGDLPIKADTIDGVVDGPCPHAAKAHPRRSTPGIADSGRHL